MKVYLAGGMTNPWREDVKAKAPNLEYLDPCVHGLSAERLYTTWDLLAVRKCDAVFVYFEADNPSGFGLSIEAGYACALGKTVILVDEKSAVDPITGKRLGMLRSISDAVFDSFEMGVEFLCKLEKM